MRLETESDSLVKDIRAEEAPKTSVCCVSDEVRATMTAEEHCPQGSKIAKG